MRALQEWLQLASAVERRELATLCGSSLGFLRQLAHGRRCASADFAGKLELATRKLYTDSGARLPIIPRGASCAACATCPYFNKKR